MIFNRDRQSLRKMYQDAWEKHESGIPMTPLETQIAEIVREHPEYHDAVTGKLQSEYRPEDGTANPFLHMSLHLAVRDQIATNRPAGIGRVYHRACEALQDQHAGEHLLCELMAEELWQAQRDGRMPDEQRYVLAAAQRLGLNPEQSG